MTLVLKDLTLKIHTPRARSNIMGSLWSVECRGPDARGPLRNVARVDRLAFRRPGQSIDRSIELTVGRPVSRGDRSLSRRQLDQDVGSSIGPARLIEATPSLRFWSTCTRPMDLHRSWMTQDTRFFDHFSLCFTHFFLSSFATSNYIYFF